MADKLQPQRKSPRLQGYDYSQEGAYFITICTYQRVYLFGDIENGVMRFSNLGQIAHNLWRTITEHRPNVELDAFVVMPNHMHGILFITGQPKSSQPVVGATRASSAIALPQKRAKGPHSGSLSAIVGAYKSAVTRTINQEMGLVAPIVWQYRFHDHIIRNQQSLNHIREYVHNNPTRWSVDTFYKR
jgi:putative transposase